jgi:hypothetical protein
VYLVGDTGLTIVDLSKPDRPRKAAILKMNGPAYDVKVRGEQAYVVGDSGLSICDIRSPTHPAILGTCRFADGRREVLLQDVLYSACMDRGIVAVDVRDSASPVQYAEFRTFSALDIAVSGGYAYIAKGRYGLLGVDVRELPEVRTVWTRGAWPEQMYTRVAIVYPYLFVLIKAYGLAVFDIKDPSAVEWVTGYRADYSLRVIHALDDFVMVAGAREGVDILRRINF